MKHATAKEGTAASNKNIRANVPFLYIFDCKSDEMHTDFLCILYCTKLALHFSGAIYTHHIYITKMYGTMTKCLFIICKERFYICTEP
jgi:hypothetical protein